jgi:DNA-binding NarL/FixJ family response regulator
MELGSVSDAVQRGASAVLSVDADRGALVAAVRAVAAGLAVVPRSLLPEFVTEADRAAPATLRGGPAAGLTPRERDVLSLLADGLANKAISARLGITEHTVKTHVAAVYEKLHARSRAEAVVAAARQGLIVL